MIVHQHHSLGSALSISILRLMKVKSSENESDMPPSRECPRICLLEKNLISCAAYISPLLLALLVVRVGCVIFSMRVDVVELAFT